MSLDDTLAREIREDFPALQRTQGGKPLAYFDGPGGTQVPRPVIEAVSRYYATCNANTHGQFPTSRDSDAVLQEAREAAAAFLNAPSWRDLSFGANMTTLAFALARALGRAWKPGDEVVITQLDHEANRGPWMGLRERGAVVKEAALRPDGTLDPEDLARQIGPRTRLVAVGYASNALGTVNDLGLARRLSREVGAWLLVDAVHAAPHFPMDVQALDADFLLCSAYKFYGPHVGLLFSRPGLLDSLEPDRLRTADQAAPFRIETGTQNHAALAGVGEAVRYLAGLGRGGSLRERVVDAMTRLSEREFALASAFHAEAGRIPGVRTWGPGFESRKRAPTVSITVEGRGADAVARALGEEGILTWDGHFYAARAVEVLAVPPGGLLRSGMALYTLEDDVARLVEGIRRVARS
ncbi:MAG: cysteine desulfurase-like protein [Acidobacteria bacterium]|nr:cysteine desulfurase-like protein [Acidobacteriota bacterium]